MEMRDAGHRTASGLASADHGLKYTTSSSHICSFGLHKSRVRKLPRLLACDQGVGATMVSEAFLPETRGSAVARGVILLILLLILLILLILGF